jgi:hypothetical protein
MLLKATIDVFIRTGDGEDPEEVAASLNRGATQALEDFPDGTVEAADVTGITTATSEEAERFAEDEPF